jgi:4'-phosphopantetheinyl transferase EntD
MKKSLVRIRLIRDNKKFQASISIVKGGLSELSFYMKILHPEELMVYESFKHNRRRTSYLLGRLSAKQVLMNLTRENNSKSIHIDSGIFQFPVIKCNTIYNIQLSITHCDDIGISLGFQESHPMGIDLEKIEEKRINGILSQITRREELFFKNSFMKNIVGYTVIWSIKEALSKILKTGLMIDFKLLEIENIIIKNNIVESRFCHFAQYRAISFIKGTYVCSIVLPKNTEADFEQFHEALNLIL